MSLRVRRQELIDRTDLGGDAFCRAYAAAADEWLTGLFDEACGGDAHGMALMAVGGYGRGELCPFSDLDVVLLHKGRKDISSTADRIWYPVWDEGISLDHSVRKPSEALDMASEDLRVALGLLDGRVICGEDKVAEPVLEGARERWARQKPPWLGVLAEGVAERHAANGDVGFLLEPDLKESHGGLRDIAALLAMMQAVPVLADYVDTVAIESARAVLTATRVELHRRAGRELNKLLLQEQEQVAKSMDLDDADALMLAVATAGRTVAWEGDDAWRRRSAWSRAQGSRGLRRKDRGGTPEITLLPGEAGIGTTVDEVVLLTDADVAGDPSLSLRLAAVAAEHNLPISRDALNLLGRRAPEPPVPWTDSLRGTLVRVLATGPAAIPALEALDQRRLLERYLPEWASVRNKPQRNPYHRFTVDRHLLEATANAATNAHRVQRVDLLLLGTLLHDIGKGFPGDHTEVGVELVHRIGPRMGFGPEDVELLAGMVEHHLLLPEVATRRDLADPATTELVASRVGSVTLLELLDALTEADSLATGPAAWGGWKQELVRELVERTRLHLGGQAADGQRWSLFPSAEMLALMGAGRLAMRPDGDRLTVVAPDRTGLFSRVAGVLSVHGLDVLGAQAHSDEQGMAVSEFQLLLPAGHQPDWGKVVGDLERALAGRFAIDARLAERAKNYGRRRQVRSAQPAEHYVRVDNSLSSNATVVEVRAPDRIGVLYRITHALAEMLLDIRHARIQTLGADVLDTFYVRGADGGKVVDPAHLAEVERALRHAVAD